MYAVSRVSSVSSARLSAPVYRVVSQGAAVRRTQSSKSTSSSTGTVRQNAVVTSSAQGASAATAMPTDLPLGLLQSVGQPPASNAQANLDYSALRTALDADNLTAAQQAYLRLQTDLYMPQLSAMA